MSEDAKEQWRINKLAEWRQQWPEAARIADALMGGAASVEGLDIEVIRVQTILNLSKYPHVSRVSYLYGSGAFWQDIGANRDDGDE